MKDRIKTIADAIARAYAYLMRMQRPEVDMGDLQVVVGFAALIYGVSMLTVPGAWMLAGSLLLLGWAIPRVPSTRREKE